MSRTKFGSSPLFDAFHLEKSGLSQESLARDDECMGASCAANALQLQGAALSTNWLAEEDPKNNSVGGCADCMMSNSEGIDDAMLGAGPRIWHYAQNCWRPCGSKSGSCPHFCGPGNACCRYRFSGPAECMGIGFWPTLSFHTCVISSVPPPPDASSTADLPNLQPASTEDQSGLAMKDDNSKSRYMPLLRSLALPSSAPMLEFYVYRAMSDSSYPLENVNAANAAGVMWYLHNEVIIFTPRKFGITRIVRFKVQYKAPEPLFKKGMDFGVRYAFDSGKCTGPGDCEADYNKYGYNVGCNLVYQFPTSQFADAKYYGDPTWYSFPGPCYTKSYKEHSEKCVAELPGGACPGEPTGKGDCTYHYEPAGQVTVDEVVGIKDYGGFMRAGGKEYVAGLGYGQTLCRYRPWLCDKGIGIAFWNNKHSTADNKRRVDRLLETFQQKYPDSPVLADVPCDFNEYHFYH